jgi:probable F420-dependent oxidoreductase
MLGLGGYQDHLDIARTAEECGWSSLGLADSLYFPEITESDYPYMDTALVRQALDGAPVLDPIVSMAQMAAVTRRIRLYPGVMKVPVRQPLALAKSLTSLAVASDNRILLGAGLSPWKEDFIYNGVPWENRGKRMDECLEIIRGISSGDYYEFHGDYYDFGRLKMAPVPSKPVPILIGGHSQAALKRAARIGDGWMSANTGFEELQALVAQLNEMRLEHGIRMKQDFEIHLADKRATTVDDFCRLQELGATDACVTVWNPFEDRSLQFKLEKIKRFAGEIIDKF